MKMQMKRLATSVALGLTLAGAVGVAKAGPTVALDTWTSTLTELTAKWTVSADLGGASFSSPADPYWRVSFPVMVLGTGSGTTINIDSVDAFHYAAPHPGESSPGPVWHIDAVTSTGGDSYYSATLAHDSTHTDIYNLHLHGNAGGSTTINLHAAHVPEPETYAMMLAGLGILGAIARRRKTRIG